MSDGTRIEISEEAKALLGRLKNPAGALRAVAGAMNDQNQLTIAHISEQRMRGNNSRPFPVEMHVLGIRTGHYRRSLRASRAQVMGSQVESGIGSNVEYAGIHEFGGVVKVGERKRTLRFKTERVRGQAEKRDKRGKVTQTFVQESRRLKKQGKYGTLWVFAKAKDTRAEEVEVTQKAHERRIPARAPVTYGIQDRVEEYGAAVSGAIVGWFEGQK